MASGLPIEMQHKKLWNTMIFSDIQQVDEPEWFWVDDKHEAKVFHAESIASSFLVRRSGEFCKGAKVQAIINLKKNRIE